LAAAPKPSIVKLVITPQGEEAFSTGISKHKAVHLVVKVDIGGAAGVIAHLAGKRSPDTHVWILAAKLLASLDWKALTSGKALSGGSIS
jgi:hypothetical protein